MTYQDKNKETFYRQPGEVGRSVPAGDNLIILEDFNARMGSNHTASTGVISQHRIGHQNSNGKLLFSLCPQHNLPVTSTCFQLNDVYKITWMHPRSKHWRLTGFIIYRQRDLPDFHITRAVRGAYCSTDHLLLRSKVNLQVRGNRRPWATPPPPPPSPKELDVQKINCPGITVA